MDRVSLLFPSLFSCGPGPPENWLCKVGMAWVGVGPGARGEKINQIGPFLLYEQKHILLTQDKFENPTIYGKELEAGPLVWAGSKMGHEL